jgi:hypothetical protein
MGGARQQIGRCDQWGSNALGDCLAILDQARHAHNHQIICSVIHALNQLINRSYYLSFGYDFP